MKRLFTQLLRALLRLLSHLPLPVLYGIADLLRPAALFYRRRVVRENIDRSFPELSAREKRRLRHAFYRHFCDQIAETFKMMTISPEEMRRRMRFEGIAEMEADLGAHDFIFIYLGHYGNWEWISSLPLWGGDPSIHYGQLYKVLHSSFSEDTFYEMRTRFGAENIDKNKSLRRITELKRAGRKSIIGFISDQSPRWGDIHLWMDFLHQDTPVFTGTERIARKVGAAIYFADIDRPRRGEYVCRLRRLTDRVEELPEFEPTRRYMQALEAMIRRAPQYWLWSHKRWKRQRNADGTPREK